MQVSLVRLVALLASAYVIATAPWLYALYIKNEVYGFSELMLIFILPVCIPLAFCLAIWFSAGYVADKMSVNDIERSNDKYWPVILLGVLGIGLIVFSVADLFPGIMMALLFSEPNSSDFLYSFLSGSGRHIAELLLGSFLILFRRKLAGLVV